MNGTILIIDDEEPLRKLLSRLLSLEGFATESVSSLKQAWPALERHPDVVLCDVKLQDGNGVAFVKSARSKYPLTEFILLTAYGNIADGVQAIKNGAFDYITKGNDNDRIIPLLHQAVAKAKHSRQSAIKLGASAAYTFEQVVGTSPLIRQAIKIAIRIAQTDASVLLQGETGTGKEVFANAIHTASKRSHHSFIAINCSAFPGELLESELFGHKAGAFTHAQKEKKGLVELADQGTLFLDEIGDMSPELQAKLLRVLESGEFVKLGDDKVSQVDLRIIAATHRDLVAAIQTGKFREDLYYRLNVVTINLPPLRERKEDIAALAKLFLSRFATRENKPPFVLNPVTLKKLEEHTWPGNIRELRNVLERAAILADNEQIGPELLPSGIQLAKAQTEEKGLSLAAIEKNHILRVLQHTNGNKTRAAEYLGIGLTTLYRKLIEYQIEK